MFYVYVLESESTHSWYIGYTQDLNERLQRHNTHQVTSTAHKGPWRHIYYEGYLDRRDAIGREKFLKSGAGWRFLKKQMKYWLEDRDVDAIEKMIAFDDDE